MTTGKALLSDLNHEQLHAVTYPDASVLVLAGAGSGKTRVLTTRIAWLVQNQGLSIHQIMAVTFTNKAAKEMAERLGNMLQQPIQAMWLGTFHGLCHRFLRRHYQAAHLASNFQIIDSADQLALIKRLLKEWQVSEDSLAPRTLCQYINAHKEAGRRATDVPVKNAFDARLVEYFASYDNYCRQQSLVDFAELMLASYEVLRRDATILQHYQQRFRHILVDEFQDTNTLQYAWLCLLAGDQAKIFAVGDDDQSIYRFRGANVGNMQKLLHDFQIAAPIRLEQNYRSSGHILHAANAVIAHNCQRLGKNLRTDAADGEKIRFFHANSDFDEAAFIVSEAKARQRDGIDLKEIAVLYRKNAQSRVLEQAFFAASLPYRIYGGLRFYDRMEIKHVLAYLRLMFSEDDPSFLRIVNTPARGIGLRTIESIQSLAKNQHCSLFQAALTMAEKHAKVRTFTLMIRHLQTLLDHIPLPELVQTVIQESGLRQHYLEQKKEQQERLENLDELINAATVFNPELSLAWDHHDDKSNHRAVLHAFLATAALESGEYQAGKQEDAIQLMTIHAAKGLEFNSVFLSGMEEGLFPGEQHFSNPDDLEEERRLMYVAITRAKERLYISAAQSRLMHGQYQQPILSRFLLELPPEVLTDLTGSLKNPTPVPERQEQNADFDGFFLGDNVRHPTFGTGVIIEATRTQKSARLTINFGAEGIKTLDTAIAILRKID